MGAYWFRKSFQEKTDHDLDVTVFDDRFVRDRIGTGRYVELETKGFVATPGHVMTDIHTPLQETDAIQDTAVKYIKRGCTLLVVKHLVSSLRHYREVYDQFTEKLNGLPLNYMVSPVVPSKILRPEMIRYFSRKGCPFLCIEVESEKDLYEISWEWMVQAQSHKRMPLTIFVKDRENTSFNYQELWSSVCKQYGIINLTDLQEDEWLTFQNLKDSGIYPKRGCFAAGGQADYNLYWVGEGSTFDEDTKFRYHDAVPNVTVMDGRVLQVNQTMVDQRPGSHVKVNIHKHFV